MKKVNQISYAHQTSIFDFIYEKRQIRKPVRIIELFGGYGSQFLALKYLGANVQSYKLVEWEVSAIEAYCVLHHQYKEYKCNNLLETLHDLGISSDGKTAMSKSQIMKKGNQWQQKVYNCIRSTNNLVNILTTKGKDLEIVKKDEYDYIMTYSFPCVDLSLSGKRAGLGKETRSGLLWQVERILLELKELDQLPQILLMENVPAILNEKFKIDFAKWDLLLSKLGYKNYISNLIASDYLIPQIRNRTFMISILDNYSYSFPVKIKEKYTIKDFVEDNVDEKYFVFPKKTKNNRLVETMKIVDDSDVQLIDCFNRTKNKKYSPTIKTGINSSSMIYLITKHGPKLLVPENTKKGYAIATDGDGIYINRPNQKRGVVQKGKIHTIKTNPSDIAIVLSNGEKLYVRKLTPRECFRFMGVKENDFNKISYMTDRALYKMAGNSIVVQVLMGIFGELLKIDYSSKIKQIVSEIK